ncbi:hypothetical protein FRACYDRAFT_271032 [Fragilariopsis cylindrus CCMP1102]|uniref:Uncharacterized protein n=1 Tax=Fragilariopsis cylindrus CCMP1102 TaxID=635003 RepID=A0A1E7EX90_9STRA|nr:hypothetical protein FRACYDRAFT_271032 [Fragilariopsis cylindrus CCMP1102]|eukprot:OEU10467.1 hypothetical protein FRACYDRAFT_271032 [Fragilariopsis cylindrus CCMP1102]
MMRQDRRCREQRRCEYSSLINRSVPVDVGTTSPSSNGSNHNGTHVIYWIIFVDFVRATTANSSIE